MHVIQVLGPGCDNCKRFEKAAHEAVEMAGIEAEVIKVADYGEIASFGILSTPASSSTGRS